MPKQRSRRVMLCYPYEDKRLVKWLLETPYAFIQTKLNGTRLIWTGYNLLSSTGLVVESLPHISRTLLQNFYDMPMDGEAYCHGMSLQEINSIVSRSRNLHEDHEKLKFHVFDIPVENVPQVDRFKKLYRKNYREDLKRTGVCDVVRVEEIDDQQGAYEFTKACVDEGYEGSVLRYVNNYYKWTRSTHMMKWKPGYRDVYKLVWMHEGEGKYEGTLGSLTVADEVGKQFRVGSFQIPDSERHELWARRAELEGNVLVQVKYIELSLGGRPPSGVFEAIIDPKRPPQ